jgi:hypothetical protein
MKNQNLSAGDENVITLIASICLEVRRQQAFAGLDSEDADD